MPRPRSVKPSSRPRRRRAYNSARARVGKIVPEERRDLLMKLSLYMLFGIIFVGSWVSAETNAAAQDKPSAKLVLREGWAVQSSTQVREAGETLSKPGYVPKEWYPASVPSTVLAVLVHNKVYPDPF